MKKLFPTNKLRAGFSSLAKCAVLCAAMIPGELSAQYNFQWRYDAPDIPSGCDRINEQVTAVAQDKNTGQYFYTGGYTVGGDDGQMICFPTQHGVITKTDDRGKFLWTKSLDYRGYYTDIKCVYDEQNQLDGLIAAGSTPDGVTGNLQKFELVRTDASGTPLYHREYTNDIGVCNKVIQVVDADGNVRDPLTGKLAGFIAVGTVNDGVNHLYVTRVDEDLNLIWDRRVDLDGCEGYSIIQTKPDNGFLIVGTYQNYTIVIKITPNGTIVGGMKKFSIVDADLEGRDIVEASPTSYFILAHTVGLNDDIVVLELNGSRAYNNHIKFDLKDNFPASTDLASGLCFTTAGNLVASCNRNGTAVLLELNTGLNSFSFVNEFSNCRTVGSVIEATDAGFSTGGIWASGAPEFHLIKTNTSGVTTDDRFNQCSMMELTPQLAEAVIRDEPGTFIHSFNYNPNVVNALSELALDDVPMCGDKCGEEQIIYYHEDWCSFTPTTTIILDNYGTGPMCWWYDVNGNPLSGSTPITLSVNTSYQFTRLCFDEYGCVTTYYLSITVYDCRIVEGPNVQVHGDLKPSVMDFSIYPNPTAGVVKVDVPVQGNETYSLRVVDMIGKELITKVNLNESSYSLDISALPAGVYQVEVQVGGELIRKKLIKQ